MVAARKDWGPILEFGTGEAPSTNLVQARKRAADHGYVSLAEPLSPYQCHAAGAASAPVYYYDGAGTAAVQVGEKMKKNQKVIGLLDGDVRSRTEVADLQIDAATAQIGWETLLDRTPLFAASLDIAYEHDSWSVMTIPELNPVVKDVEDVVGSEGVVPHYRQGSYNNRHIDANGDGVVDDLDHEDFDGDGDFDDECPGCCYCYGDDACDPTAVYPYYVGSAPDPWGYGTDDGHPCAWDGCTTIAGAMVLGYWMNRGYVNLDCGIDDKDTEDALIDLCHLKMETDDLGYTHDIEWVGPGGADFWPVFMHRVTTGLHNVAALYSEPFYFGYDFKAEDHFPIAVTDVKSEIDAGRPMLLHYQADNHSVAVIGYAEVLSEEAAEQNPLYPFDLYLHIYDCWDDDDDHYILYGNWGWAASTTTVIPQNCLTLEVEGNGSVEIDPEREKYDFGAEVTLTATPADGWYFAGWKGDTETIADIYAAETTITMELDYEVTASFRRIAPSTPPALQLTFNEYDDVSPDVFGDRVVWSGYDGSDNEVYTWTPGGGTDQVTNNGYDDCDPQVSGHRIAWSGYDGSDSEVFTWTPAGGVVQLTNNDGIDDERPQVSGDRVVWEASEAGGGGGGGEVMMAASVALEAQSEGEDLGILTWTPTGGTTQIAQSDGQASPQISGRRIVWSGYDGFDYEIFTWTPGGGTSQITDNDSIDDFDAQVSGDRVVWETWGAVSADFTWTPEDGITQLPQSQSMPSCPQVSGDRVVWQRYDGSDWQVCTWTPAEGVRQLTNGHYEEQQPMVPGCYDPQVSGDRVVWYGWWDDLDTEIYTAVFDTDRDTDGDGLPDYWELTGDIDGDGESDLDLPAMGADPLHKDVFVEIDWLTSSHFWFIPARDHEPKALALERVVEAFADAPVQNPDGTTGITLHIDAGPESFMNGETSWGSYSRAEAISVPIAGTLGTGYNNSYDWDAFDALKETNFDAERAEVFHYCIFAHTLPGNMTGVSRGEADGASDFIVADGARGGESLTVLQQSGTFMHELGHNLGLRHGGGDPVNYKPNYLSVMNYAFQLTGLLQMNGMSTALDFSRFKLFSLDENALNEATGLTPPAGLEGRLGTRLLTVYRANGIKMYWYDGPADWDGDGTIEVGVQADINSDGDYSMLSGFDDWASLRFNGGWVGQAGVALPETTPADEISYEQFVALGFDHGPYAVRLGGSQIAQVCPGWRGHLPVTIENFGDMDDSYDVEVVSSSALMAVTGIPQTLSLAAGEQSELLLGLDVPLSQPDGHVATVRVVVTSRSGTGNVDECTMTIESAKPTLADSLSVLDQVVAALRAYAAEAPPVSSLLTSAAEDVEEAASLLDDSPVDRVAVVTGIRDAIVSMWQSIDDLAAADAGSQTPGYTTVTEGLGNYSTLLLLVARDQAEQTISEAEAAGAPAGAIAAARSHLGDGDEAFAQGDHVTAATEYTNAANPTSNQVPEVEISPPAPVFEGSAFLGSGYFTDLDSTSWAATIDYGDGSEVEPLTLAADNTYASVHTYEDNGVYNLTVNVTDGEGGTGTATGTVTVDNVSPVIGIIVLPEDPQALNAAVTAQATFTDPGIVDTHTATWDWGDGTTSVGTVAENGGSGSAAGTHAYDVPGFYAVSVTVIDKDGAGSTGLAQNVQILGVVLYAGGDATLSGSCRVGTPLVSGRPSAAAYVGGELTVRGSADLSRAALYEQAGGATVPPLTQFMPEAYVASLVLASQAAQATGTSYNGLKLSGAGSASYAGAITVNGDLAISGAGAYSFDSVHVTGNVTISGSPTVSFGSLYVGGTLKVSGGAATQWGPTYVAGNTTLSGSGQWNGSLLVTRGALTVTGGVTLGGDGAGAHAGPVRILVIGAGKPATLSGSGTLYGLLYDQSGSVTQSGSSTVYGSVLCGGSYTASGSGGLEHDQEVLGRLE